MGGLVRELINHNIDRGLILNSILLVRRALLGVFSDVAQQTQKYKDTFSTLRNDLHNTTTIHADVRILQMGDNLNQLQEGVREGSK
jgi:hypothetical protein